MKFATGCSFTYGEELEDRSLAWPALLGYENHGLRGASNEYIFRRSAELAPKATHMIIAWSDSSRHEVYTQKPVNVAERHAKTTGVIQINSNWSQPWFGDYYKYYTHELHQFLRTLVYMVTLQDVLDVNKVDWHYCSAFSNQLLFKKYMTDPACMPWIARLNTSRYIGFPDSGMVEWAYGTPQGPAGHPLELGHRRIADEIQKYI